MKASLESDSPKTRKVAREFLEKWKKSHREGRGLDVEGRRGALNFNF